MAGPGSNPFASNRHADVLGEEPSDEAGKLRLAEEVKNRAKGAFQQKDMPSAELLYGKAIKLLESLPGKQEAVLYSNRAMVRLNLNKPEEALQDCNSCLGLDPKSVKALHRKAEALTRLNEWDDAIATSKEGLAVDASNSAFQKLIDKAEADKAKDVEDKKKLRSDAQDVRVELHNASTARQPVKKPERNPGADEDSSMRGYKKTADGKTTSYFHTEISEEAKRLIADQGFGKPQKLDTTVADQDAKGGGSQWNQAGTYEEKGMMKWMTTALQTCFKEVVFDLPVGGQICVTGVDDIKGEASISSSRGKRRHILDLGFAVSFGVQLADAAGAGKFVFTEVTSDDEPGISVEVDASTPPAVREILNAFAKPAGQGMQPLVRNAFAALVEEYKKQ